RRRIKQRDRAIGRRPWVSREQPGNHRVLRAAERCNLARIRHSSNRVQAYAFALTFVAREPERLVFDDGPAGGEAELVVSKSRLRIGLGVEEVARVEPVVTEELEQRAVKVVGPGLGNDVYDCAGVAAILCFEVREYRGFCDCFDGKNGGGSAE